MNRKKSLSIKLNNFVLQEIFMNNNLIKNKIYEELIVQKSDKLTENRIAERKK